MSETAQTPLLDLLRRVPVDARAIYEHGPYEHQAIPYGRHCKAAAHEIERLTAEVERLETLCLRWLRKWQTEMDPTPEMLEDTHALIRDERK